MAKSMQCWSVNKRKLLCTVQFFKTVRVEGSHVTEKLQNFCFDSHPVLMVLFNVDVVVARGKFNFLFFSRFSLSLCFSFQLEVLWAQLESDSSCFRKINRLAIFIHKIRLVRAHWKELRSLERSQKWEREREERASSHLIFITEAVTIAQCKRRGERGRKINVDPDKMHDWKSKKGTCHILPSCCLLLLIENSFSLLFTKRILGGCSARGTGSGAFFRFFENN